MRLSVTLIALAIGGVAATTSPSLAPAFRVVSGTVVVLVVLFAIRHWSGLRFPLGKDGADAAQESSDPVRITTTVTNIGDPQRRAAIKMLGFGTLGALPVFAASGVMDRIVAGSNSGKRGMAQAGSATTKDGRIRQWTMFIDLRYCDGCQSQGHVSKDIMRPSRWSGSRFTRVISPEAGLSSFRHHASNARTRLA
jgi:hypothetical protein